MKLGAIGNTNGIVHGDRRRDYRAPEYISWNKMRERCRNPKSHAYSRYGGRGITVCERWDSYANFLADMGRRPTPNHSIDRIDNDKGYEPGNCRWATKVEQSRNRCDNTIIEFNGKRQSVAAWADELNMSRNALYLRLSHGMAPEAALTTPVKRTRRVKN